MYSNLFIDNKKKYINLFLLLCGNWHKSLQDLSVTNFQIFTHSDLCSSCRYNVKFKVIAYFHKTKLAYKYIILKLFKNARSGESKQISAKTE